VSVQIQSIERAAAVLRSLTGGSRRRGVAEIAQELCLPKGTVYGILRTLKTIGYVEQDTESGKYRLGGALLHIGASYLQGNELRYRAIPWADALAADSGESVRVGVLHKAFVLIVHHVFRSGDSLQTLDVGSLMPVHATALGKALLAHHRYLASESAACSLASYTPATVTDRDRLNAQLDDVLTRGWASDVEELLPGTASIAAPVESGDRVVVGAVAISGRIERLCERASPRAELVAYVIETARRISYELGGSAW
jgi:DNA-binding IclR family transcriptional regulator